MTATLVEVEAGQGEAPASNGLNIITLEAIRALVKRQSADAPLVFTDPETGFSARYRPLNGSQRAAARAAAVKSGTLNLMEMERETVRAGLVEPKFDDTLWVALGAVRGGLREGLLTAIQKASGMDADAATLADAKKDSTETEESAASGIG